MLYATSVYVLLLNFTPLGFVYHWSSWGCLFACKIMNEHGCSLPFCVLFVIINQIKNQITFIVTSPQHKCLGEWNSYERAPDSAKNKNNLHMDRQCKKTNNNLHMDSTYLQTVQKTMCKIHIHILSTQCTIKAYSIINDTLYTVWAHLHYVQYLYIM